MNRVAMLRKIDGVIRLSVQLLTELLRQIGERE
jgi:hypothetical protein